MFPRISSVDERVRLSENFPRIRDAEKRMKEHEKQVREIYGGDIKSSTSTKSKTKSKIPTKKTNKKPNLAQSMSTITLNSSYDGTVGSPEDETPSKGIYHSSFILLELLSLTFQNSFLPLY
jgi:hypothetical protein